MVEGSMDFDIRDDKQYSLAAAAERPVPGEDYVAVERGTADHLPLLSVSQQPSRTGSSEPEANYTSVARNLRTAAQLRNNEKKTSKAKKKN